MLVRSAGRSARAFTLVEILFAVMVLGIALLGLGAFFPVVVRQQQVAQDATLGVLASQSAQAQLKGRSYNGATLEAYLGAWARVQTPASFIPNDGTWVTPIDPITGGLYFGTDPLLSPAIALADRLYPADASGAAAPQFVWDLAVRRIEPRLDAGLTNIQGSDSVQGAIFVRRLDPRLALPRGTNGVTSLYQCLQDPTLPDEARRWPVTVALNPTAGGIGEPMLDGRVGTGYGYSAPVQVDVQFPAITGPTGGVNGIARDRLAIRRVSTTDALSTMSARRVFQLLAQPGQQFVDNLGNVYTVLGADPDPASADNLILRFSPSVPESVPASNPNNPASLKSILMTPQAPAAILVFTVRS